MKILVLGYFGYVTNQIDGQTIKTRDIYTLLRQNCREDVDFFDTQSFKKSKFGLFKMLFMIFRSDVLFYLPAQNNLKYIFPIVYLLSKLCNTKINYLVVGGWLFNFLENKPIHRYMLSKINGIYTETENLYVSLKRYGFVNLFKLHNFRVINTEMVEVENQCNKKLKLVFMARVHPLKGVDLIFKLDEEIRKKSIDIQIDVYGPIFQEYKEEFFNKVNSASVEYKGVLDPIDVYKTLTQYNLMLFPTKYYTEGFPGTILDSYIAGVPVIATNWLNAKEFVDDGETGYITDFYDESLFIEKVVQLIDNPEELYNLRKNVKIKRYEYSAEKAWKILKNSLYGTGNEY
ncbi:glycosyltransferase [Acinetobacter haemolyticus]|uniref:glycosyltransferase n=1 Tax=Acinetobacter haemolyticus TaxID=29430 RepID=UPI00137250FD|nr:glycosyltransferase [Acinetobacter haemolyticus]NAR17274.1 glycosyltransferase [Acinetobacter haemolyticus]